MIGFHTRTDLSRGARLPSALGFSVCLLLACCAVEQGMEPDDPGRDRTGMQTVPGGKQGVRPESTPDGGSARRAAGDVASDGELATEDASGATRDRPDAGNDRPDAASDVHDSGAAVDAGQGGPGAPDARSAAAPFCSAVGDAAACADFEDGGLEAWSWDEVTPGSGAGLAIVDDGDKPGSGSLRASLTGAADESARVALELPSELSWFRVSFDFQPSLHLPAAPGLPLIWCKLQQRAGDTFPGVSLASRSDGTSLLIQNYDGAELSYREYRLPALPGGWTRIELALTFGERGGVRVGYDGELAMEYAEIPIGSRQVVQTAFELGLFSQQTPASSALYDNVVIDYR